MVHRDIKPDNILLDKHGNAKLADLGLARQVNDDAGLTLSGQAVGTPHYMAPEQVRGQSDQVDIRTDLYALGATLFHLVTGQPPFSGETSAVVMSKHLTETAPLAHRLNPAVSENCSRLIARLMQKKREQRVQTPLELSAQIEKLLNPKSTTGPLQPVRGDTTGPREGVRTSLERRGSVREHAAPEPQAGGFSFTSPIVLAGAALLFIGVVAVYVLTSKPEPRLNKTVSTSPKPPEPPTKPATPPAPAAPAKEKPAVTPLPSSPPPEAPAPSPLASVQPLAPEPSATVLTTASAPSAPPPPPAAPVKPREWGGFKGEYFAGPAFETSKKVQQDKIIQFTWPSGVPEGFEAGKGCSVRWTGYVEPAEKGEYVFEVRADEGARLYLDECLIFDSWFRGALTSKTLPVRLESGKKYLLRFDVWNQAYVGGAGLLWGRSNGPLSPVEADPPETEKQGLPVGHLEGGWLAEYGHPPSTEALLTRKETAVAWDWTIGSPGPLIHADQFWARWTGKIVPPETEEYTFHLEGDEGARLYINGMLLLDAFFVGPSKLDTYPIRLEKDKAYLARVEFRDDAYGARCFLEWSSKTLSRTPVRALATDQADGVLDPPVGFWAEYGNGAEAKPRVARREIQAGWNWTVGSPAPEISVDGFWATYTGWITPKADGEYTFAYDHEQTDGLRLYVDDVLFADTWHAHGAEPPAKVVLSGGKRYFVRLEFHNSAYGSRLGLQWGSAQMPMETVRALVPEAVKAGAKEVGHLESGLLAEYRSMDRKNTQAPLTRREACLFYNWGIGSPDASLPVDGFSARWLAQLKVDVTGEYIFKLEADDKGEVKLQNVSIVKVLRPGAAEGQPMTLQKDVAYNFEATYTDLSYGAFMKLSWKPPGKAEFEPVPPRAFLLPPAGKALPRRLPK